MSKIIDAEKLLEWATKNAKAYQTAEPFPYIVADNFLKESAAEAALESFPSPKEFEFYKYDNPLEKKLAFDQVSKLPKPIAEVLQELNSVPFLNVLETLTGIEGLIPDPYYRGGGIHQILPGGKLDVHIDFNIHPKLKLQRRLNILVYLNKEWTEEYGGHFELWSGKKENGKHVLNKCEVAVLPIFNRMAMFSTSEKSYHGHPNPLACKEGMSRKSIALYYYTVDRPEEEKADAHSTTFIKRPEDPEDQTIDEMRDKRNQGRFRTDVISKFTS